MAILGVESVIFGVDDLETCSRFWEDFGLTLLERNDHDSHFEVHAGSRVIVMRDNDPRLPPRVIVGNGIRLSVWGVDTQENLEKLVRGLETDTDVTRGDDGAAFFQAPDGQHLGLRVWNRKPVVSNPDPVNAPGNIKRLNQTRQWRHRAIPKTINHIVFFSPDYVASYEFYRDKLNFRYSDHSKGAGIFARADGANEHHNIFWVNSDLPFARDGFNFMHIAFGLDDIDEVMLGGNLMERKGWKNTSMNASQGLSRHRLSSAIYYYIDNPGGGEAEYHADTDYLDDNWVPRAWGFKFAALLWSVNTPPFMRGDDIAWEMEFDPDERSFEPYRKGKVKPEQAALDRLTTEDEHAL